VGGVLQAQGKLEAAQAAFAEYLAISQRLAEQDPSNADWQRELAVAHSRVGDVLQAQGKLDSALSAFTAALAISRRLLEQDPSNTIWQRDLASTHSQMGELFAALSRIEEAKEHRRRALEIRQLLASQEPDNTALQREIAIALSAFESSDDEQCDSTLRDAADREIRSIARNLDQLRTSRGETTAVSKTAPGPAQLFICYSSEDHKWRRALESTLTILQNRGVISFWYDRKVSAGDDWNEEIQRKLDESEIVLFLISRHFLASRYINEKELPKALARHKAGKARLIPLILAACSWDKTPLYRLQTATGDRRPLRNWRDKDAAYYRIETELENVWCELRGLSRAPSHPVQ
jgi:tetratricopeptide (TPR) repeat protein